MSADTIYALIPEMLVVLVATFVYVAGAFTSARTFWTLATTIGLLVAAGLLVDQYRGLFWPNDGSARPIAVAAVAGPLAIDLFGMYARFLALGVGLVFTLILTPGAVRPRPGQESPSGAPENFLPESLGSLLLIVAGLMLVAGARDLALVFLGLELISIPTYILLFLAPRSAGPEGEIRGHEATAKYFFLSILSSAVLLYGFSFLYGVAGSTDLARIAQALGAESAPSAPAKIGLALVVAGLAFRLALVPFHFYAPDVYQGTSLANAGLLSIVPKIAGVLVMTRVLIVAAPGLESFGWRIALVLSMLTMTLGNLLALWQRNLRRMFAYSSIAHGGYLMIGLASAFALAGAERRFDGVAAALVYLSVYAIASAGAFAAWTYLGRDDRPIENVAELAGLCRSRPWAALAIAVSMFSLAGIPPLAGFWGKFHLFSSAIELALGDTPSGIQERWFLALSIVGVLNAAVAATYYLRVVAAMYFQPEAESRLPAQGGWGPGLAMFACLALSVAAGLYPRLLSTGATAASESTRPQATADLAAAFAGEVAPPERDAIRR